MTRLILAAPILAAALCFAGGASAQETACVRPVPPTFPASGATLSQTEIETHRATRDAYFSAADANLTCMDRAIDVRMQQLFATGAPMDPAVRQLGAQHEAAAKERGLVYERFLRMCLAWEDARQTKLPGGCTPAS
jgi:hypothetical protein